MNKKNKIMAFFILYFTFAIIACTPGNGLTPTAHTYAIGDTGPSGVGIVFYITDGGLHGLEVAPSLWDGGSVDPKSVWSNVDGSVVGTDTAIGTGLANSDAIIAQLGHTTSAAKLCRDYTGGGKTDWFLPSKDELIELWTQRATIGGFVVDFYWSSSEASDPSDPSIDPAIYAWLISFYPDGTAYPKISKADSYYVRPVRAF
jgi:hypothetical protein